MKKIDNELTLAELEGQSVELLADRIEMRRCCRRRCGGGGGGGGGDEFTNVAQQAINNAAVNAMVMPGA